MGRRRRGGGEVKGKEGIAISLGSKREKRGREEG